MAVEAETSFHAEVDFFFIDGAHAYEYVRYWQAEHHEVAAIGPV